MRRRVIRHGRALLDLEEHSEYIRSRNPSAAIRFLDAAEATFRRLATMPGLGAAYKLTNPALADIRYIPISKFTNYIVFYRPMQDGVRILRVLHGARGIRAIFATELDPPEGTEGDATAGEVGG